MGFEHFYWESLQNIKKTMKKIKIKSFTPNSEPTQSNPNEFQPNLNRTYPNKTKFHRKTKLIL